MQLMGDTDINTTFFLVFCTEVFNSRNPTSRVIRFLDEQSSLTEDLQIMSSMHLRPFIAATIDVLAMRLRNRL